MTSKEDVEQSYKNYQYYKGRFDRLISDYYIERPNLMTCGTSEIDLYDDSSYIDGYELQI